MTTLEDEFEIYDSCTADCLEKGDIILWEDEFVEILTMEDAGTVISLTAYAISWEENIELDLDPDRNLNLYRYAD